MSIIFTSALSISCPLPTKLNGADKVQKILQHPVFAGIQR